MPGPQEVGVLFLPEMESIVSQESSGNIRALLGWTTHEGDKVDARESKRGDLAEHGGEIAGQRCGEGGQGPRRMRRSKGHAYVSASQNQCKI